MWAKGIGVLMKINKHYERFEVRFRYKNHNDVGILEKGETFPWGGMYF